MAYTIIGESIKSATSIKLGQIFTNPTRYKETITNPTYPNFFIQQVQLNITPAGTRTQNRIQLDYLMNIRYRVAEDIQRISNLQQKLDEVGLKLTTELTELDLGKPVKTKNRYYLKDEGVLQFFFNITIFAIPEEEDIAKMQKLELNEEVR